MHLGGLVSPSKYDGDYFLGRVLRVSKQVFKRHEWIPQYVLWMGW